MKKEFIPIDFDSIDINKKTYIQVFGRDKNNKRICTLQEFNDFFYIITENPEKLKTKLEKIEIEGKYPKKIEIQKKKFLGKEVQTLKVLFDSTSTMKSFSQKFETYESDINTVTKYLIENKITPMTNCEIEGEILNNSEELNGIDSVLEVDEVIKISSIKPAKNEIEFEPKVLAYDIETSEFEIGKGEVVMISLFGKNLKKVITWKSKSKKDFVETVKDESELLERFVEEVKKYSPDFLVGYFSDGFDLPYLRARADKNKVNCSLGLDNSKPRFSRGNMISGRIKGIVHIDVFKFIQTAYSQYLQSETLTLNEVASELIGEKKKDIEHLDLNKINKFTEKELEDFYEYNLQDSVITEKLFQKIWPDILEFSKVIGEPTFKVSREGMSQNVENYIMHHIGKFNEIIHPKPEHHEISERMNREKYEGAFVFQPTPGLYENLAMFDFTSYYPSIIVSFNLSKSTRLEKKEKDSLEIEIDKKKYYFTKKQGFFPEMLKEIIEKRKQYKKEYSKNPSPLLKARSNAFKLVANASYGYQGFFGARYYCPEASAATTAVSREFIKKMIKEIDSAGFKSLYSDTDSIALLLNKKTKEEAKEFLKKINSTLPGVMELELEDFYKRGIWVTKRTGTFGAKKKYALIDYKDKLKIRGFETVRRDWCDLARELQNKVLNLILSEGNERKAVELTKEIIEKIKKRKIPLKELIIKTQLKKPIEEYKSESPHVTIAKRMQEKNMPVNIGMLIQYYIAETDQKKKTLIRDRAKLIEEKGEYDIEYYLNNQIIPAVENIFEVFGVNAKELVEKKKQTSLGDF